jgi:predicted permease
MPVVIQGKPAPKPGQEPQADLRVASTGYFNAMGIPLLRGRDFLEADDPNSTSVMIINDTMARRLFAGEDPIGRRILLYGRPREIVGVVGSVRHRGFREEARPEMILPYRQFQLGGMTLVVRSPVAPNILGDEIRKIVLSIDPLQPAYRNRTMEEFVADSVARPRFVAILLGSFALLAMALATIGIYGVVSYAVARRSYEIGVRMALGADRNKVVRMVIGRGLALALAGVAAGMAGAAALARFMQGMLFGVHGTDPLTYVISAAILIGAACAASYLPARRAARLDPMTALQFK